MRRRLDNLWILMCRARRHFASAGVVVQLENLDVEGERHRGQPPLVHHRRQVVLELRLEPEPLQEARQEEEYLGPVEDSLSWVE